MTDPAGSPTPDPNHDLDPRAHSASITPVHDSSHMEPVIPTSAASAARPTGSVAHSPARPRRRDSPSPSAYAQEPLSTDVLPIPDPPQTEAEDAFQQVFDTIEPGPQSDSWSDSGYSESVVDSTSTSLSSSVRDYEFENGRRYHAYASGRYLLPNDDAEQEREDMKHSTVLTVCAGKLHFAPLDEQAEHQMKILDLGTGTGIWCVEMGDEYPSAEIIGVDLSPHQPDWVPPNVRFEVDDIESEWLWPKASMTMVHARHMRFADR